MRTNSILILMTFLFFLSCGGGNSSEKKSSEDPLVKGPDLFALYACVTCHSLDGTKMYGPTLSDIYMKEVSVLRDGRILTLKADEKYLYRAIADPSYEKVRGFEKSEMPVPNISSDEVKLLVDYLKALAE